MNEKLKFVNPAVLLAALVAIGWFLLEYESEYLWKAQELNLFLDTPLFFHQQMKASAWLLTWLGSYFTEFFYYPWQGIVILCLWWALLIFVMWRTFRVPLKWTVVLLVPIAALLITDVGLGYWIYYVKLRGHFFAATIGTTIAVASVWLFRSLPVKYYLRPLYMVLSTAVLYPLIGFYGLLSTLLMVIIVWRLEGSRIYNIVTTAVGLTAVVACPLFCYYYVFCETNLTNIWWTGLPIFVFDKEYHSYYTPYYILGVSLAVMAVTYKSDRIEKVQRPWLWAVCQVVLIAALVYGVNRFWYKDYNFHKELRMQYCLEHQDWEGILSEAAYTEEEPTRAIVMMKNLALFRLGRQSNKMYHYRTGAKASVTPIPLSMTQVVGRTIYFHYGLTNYCHRWCLEDGVEYGWRVEFIKYMALCSLVNGEEKEARKYFNILKHTRYFGEWVARYEPFLGHPKKLRANKEFEQIFHLMTSGDILGSDNTLVEKFLMNQFAYNGSKDKLYQEQSVLSALWVKDIPLFWNCFFNYAETHIGEPMPIHFQEAAYLYGHLEKHVDISRMPFDKEVVKNYEDFMEMAKQCQNMSEEQMQKVLYPRFGHTYYYDYFLIRNQKLY